ncbi:bifunctional UDP-N-acetylglucosamine diphosphorylase/glucosamine-1-phosphate N-acetyltransferase GlmU [Rhizobium sp. S96]|uniref:bifunctional UDP-N-acetylglucosamine diphosphorylase/glucosamine-1-phosphate N-acetyltransferase GlmU n=1 Tax=Rhizobium sp. S96 TaxID=3055140 RepID=UPI0025AB55AC|nr:bifunctional UDP-N-acetylglucosamine diphosphorylase/glucosamine-1-phosphate N-acetyltransferase GlmU [Rhizobium sp. S96]MDM9624077.1 bifunctional UDP-N-acetylglucosamine diphosphorylase/glucosamine-1-phosphate N-acetyltransferase GlmU [Rhizobium sp. S96]
MRNPSCLAIILAAGDSTRMKSRRSKVLHPVAGRPMIAHVLDAISEAGVSEAALVVGRDADAIGTAATGTNVQIETFLQSERLGTAHAVLAARAAIARGYDEILVTYGDVPLITGATLRAARTALADGSGVAVIGFEAANPTGYGRLLVKDGELLAIREEKDATDEERLIRRCNSGIMAISGRHAIELITQVSNDNAKGEYYLTDIVEIARARGIATSVVDADENELAGCNNRQDLAAVERFWQERRRRELMLSGVSLIAPETVFLCHDTVIEPDVTVEPNVVFGPGVRVETGAVIGAFSHLEGAHVSADAHVGPYARLRAGSRLARGSKVGNFCEIKNAMIGEGTKVNHLSYIGDAQIGSGTNIGAGTITCNYDGVNKHLTTIGSRAFIGSNASLVAPLNIGDGVIVAAGSTITADVPSNALAFGRARQETKPERANTARKTSRA